MSRGLTIPVLIPPNISSPQISASCLDLQQQLIKVSNGSHGTFSVNLNLAVYEHLDALWAFIIHPLHLHIYIFVNTFLETLFFLTLFTFANVTKSNRLLSARTLQELVCVK